MATGVVLMDDVFLGGFVECRVGSGEGFSQVIFFAGGGSFAYLFGSLADSLEHFEVDRAVPSVLAHSFHGGLSIRHVGKL